MLTAKPSFNDVVGALLSVTALAVVAYLACVLKSEQSAGAIIALLAAASGWLFRGRVEKTEPSPPPAAPPVVEGVAPVVAVPSPGPAAAVAVPARTLRAPEPEGTPAP